jgi:hypothetical protein
MKKRMKKRKGMKREQKKTKPKREDREMGLGNKRRAKSQKLLGFKSSNSFKHKYNEI